MNKESTGGRPISAQASAALKEAALRLVRAKGYNKVSIAVIAKEAGVARQTLYNRWNTKADLVLDALFEEAQNYAAAPSLNDTRDSRVLLEEFLTNVFHHLTDNGDMMRALIAAAQIDRAFHDTFYAKFVLPRDRMITDLLRLAQTRGEFSSDRNAELVSGFIHGAFWYRLLNRKALNADFARAIISEFFD
ncbi:TetR family transcriptional regulator [Loktanella sp. D2R18]|uniref:TetR/AcrR family transcriptional regulator n=1 Tax=Rhodobacterales TaxID=204455 RepID=UPI000DEB9C1E|nr:MULTISPECIES: TetR/AcrR family transcriptional regulator [Rhodobacterales]MDO6591480.1 TetR/AcrR family transcriptional regulator [Yoonia sp. 1_MG-2023]RBW43881.1 TetR family transcriptional regulator [Loktanella sp. D2R18]